VTEAEALMSSETVPSRQAREKAFEIPRKKKRGSGRDKKEKRIALIDAAFMSSQPFYINQSDKIHVRLNMFEFDERSAEKMAESIDANCVRAIFQRKTFFTACRVLDGNGFRRVQAPQSMSSIT
jgi:hypothetical protein